MDSASTLIECFYISRFYYSNYFDLFLSVIFFFIVFGVYANLINT